MEGNWLLAKYRDVFKRFTSLDRVDQAMRRSRLDLGTAQNIELYNSAGYELLLDSIDLIVTTCKLTDTSDGTESVYAFIYSEIAERGKPVLPHDVVDGKIVFKYYCVGPSHISRDGEYKGNFTSFRSILAIKEKMPDLWKALSEYVMHHFYRRKLQITTEHFYPTNTHATYDEKIEISIRKNRFPVDLFIIVWYMHVMHSIQKTMPQNVNPKLNMIFQRHMKDDIALLLNVIQLAPGRSLQLLYKMATEFKPHVRFGQKLIPLNLAEVQNPFNIYYKPWREYVVAATLSDLAINNVCGSFPIVNRWLYMRNIKKGLFDNAIQFEKLDKSDSAKEIINVMVQAYKYSSHITDESKKSLHEGASWLENRFHSLSESIKRAIDYAKRELIMSDTVLGIVMERVDYTFMDVLKLGNTQAKAELNILKKEHTATFARHIFEICYALYCMSDLYGIIHADLHLNNVSFKNSYAPQEEDVETISMMTKAAAPSIWTLIGAKSRLAVSPLKTSPSGATVPAPPPAQRPTRASPAAEPEPEPATKRKKKSPTAEAPAADVAAAATTDGGSDPLVLYVMGDNVDEQYIFPTNGYVACVFDFSRCIVHPAKAMDMHLPSLPKSYAPVDDMSKFTRDQIEKMTALCVMHFSEYADKQDEIYAMFKNNFDACFMLMTAFDIFSFTQKLLMYLQTEEKRAPKENIALLKKINTKAEFYLTTELNAMLKDQRYAQKILHIEKPMVSIIKEVFAPFNVMQFGESTSAAPASGTIVDMFVFNREAPYTLNIGSKFPPYLADMPQDSDRKYVSWTAQEHQKNVQHLTKFETKQRLNLKMIEYIANRHGEKYF